MIWIGWILCFSLNNEDKRACSFYSFSKPTWTLSATGDLVGREKSLCIRSANYKNVLQCRNRVCPGSLSSVSYLLVHFTAIVMRFEHLCCLFNVMILSKLWTGNSGLNSETSDSATSIILPITKGDLNDYI